MSYDFPSSVTSQIAAEASARALRNVFEHQAFQRDQLSQALQAMEAELKRREIVARTEAAALQQQIEATLERLRTQTAQVKLLSDIIAFNAISHYYNQGRLLDEKALSEVSTAVRQALDQKMELEGLINRREGEKLLAVLREKYASKPPPQPPIQAVAADKP